jgi:2-polyprenyl-3-methyl-5-hydroxy-6-metoxy-1,4-benzoquinol methylase
MDKRLLGNHSIGPYPETADIETSSEDYAQRFSGKIGEWFLKVQEEATLRMLSSCSGASVLDVGGGHGQLTEALIQNGYKVTVFGSSEICKNRIQKWLDQNRCDFRTGNLLDLPYPDCAYDIVISYRLLPHVMRWRQLIAELTRVARKAVIVDYPAIQSLNCLSPFLFNFKKLLEGNTRPYALFRKSEIIKAFEMNRFVVSAQFPEFFFPIVLHKILKSPAFSLTAEKLCRFVGLTFLFGSPIILKLVREHQVTL